MSFSCLGKVAGTGARTLGRWKSSLRSVFHAACRHRPLTQAPLVIGLAESGIIPSALFHQIVRETCPNAGWICSTRRPSAGIRFSEHHSHAPNHILPDPDTRPTELWFVEDEITTGQTLLNLSIKLCRHLNQPRVRYIAFTDIRTPEMKHRFRSILAAGGITFSVHTLFAPSRHGGVPVPDYHQSSAVGALLSTSDLSGHFDHANDAGGSGPLEASPPFIASDWHFPDYRPALRRQFHSDIRIPTGLAGSLLAVGEAVDLGVRIVQANPGLQLHHITLSPWEVDAVTIQNRLDIGDAYYLYNIHKLRPPLYILNDPLDGSVADAARRQLEARGFQTHRLRLTREPD